MSTLVHPRDLFELGKPWLWLDSTEGLSLQRVDGGDGRSTLPPDWSGAGGWRERCSSSTPPLAPHSRPVRTAASTWLPHQHPLWQAAPNADGADVSGTVPFFSSINSANFNPEAESEGVGGRGTTGNEVRSCPLCLPTPDHPPLSLPGKDSLCDSGCCGVSVS